MHYPHHKIILSDFVKSRIECLPQLLQSNSEDNKLLWQSATALSILGLFLSIFSFIAWCALYPKFFRCHFFFVYSMKITWGPAKYFTFMFTMLCKIYYYQGGFHTPIQAGSVVSVHKKGKTWVAKALHDVSSSYQVCRKTPNQNETNNKV